MQHETYVHNADFLFVNFVGKQNHIQKHGMRPGDSERPGERERERKFNVYSFVCLFFFVTFTVAFDLFLLVMFVKMLKIER